MASARSSLGRGAADPRGERLSAEQGSASRHVALRADAAAPGGHARVRHGVAASQHCAGRRGKALLLDHGPGRVASYRGVAEARDRSRRHGRARSAPRQARAHDPRGGHTRGEGLPDAGLLRAADHLEVPSHRPFGARHAARRALRTACHGRRHPPRRGHGLREGAPAESLEEDEPEARRRRQPSAARVRRARFVAAAGAGVDRARNGVARRRASPGGPRARRPIRRVARPRRQRRPADHSVTGVNATLMDGAALAARLREEVKQEVAGLGHVGLATVLVGDDPASDVYIRLKHKASDAAGIAAVDYRLPAGTTEDELVELVEELNGDDTVDGILVQTPLPEQIDEARIMRAIDPMKDVDGLHPVSAGQLYLGRQTLVPAPPPGVMQLLTEYRISIAAARAVVVGRSPLVGKPMAMLLLQANATVTICHSRTEDLARHTLDADLLVAAVGLPGVITSDMVKQGAAVGDGGITRTEAGLGGDGRPNVGRGPAGLTPVPGGGRAVKIAGLLGNAVRAARD